MEGEAYAIGATVGNTGWSVKKIDNETVTFGDDLGNEVTLDLVN